MDTLKPIQDQEEYRDTIATVDNRGNRVWMYPKMPKGRFFNMRTYLSWVLLAVLFITPLIKINGEPIILLNVLERKFILFGLYFAPQDFHLFVLAMLSFMVFIILFTVVYGRIFCGWICPQTIFMEMVFRKIEYLIEGKPSQQKKLNNGPWNSNKIIKKGLKFGIFFAIAILISNTFLAYIIGFDEVSRIVTEPVSENFGGFVAMLIFSAVFYFVFAYLREQVCIAICPYGRLQGVLLDKSSIVIAYDYVRGEPRGKLKKKRKAKKQPDSNVAIAASASVASGNPVGAIETLVKQGDCIDCKLCVQVCPTGIDIRDGTQLECINCTACIDACDEVMDKIGKPRGLIRYDSEIGILENKKKLFTPRVIAYTGFLTVLLGITTFLLTSRTDVEAIILRTPGMLYQKVDDTYISNLYNYQIINKTKEEFPIEFKLISDDGKIRTVGEVPDAKANDVIEGAFFIDMNKNELESRKNKLTIEVYSDGKLIDKVKTTFLGPMK
ncbi:MAG: cytochrome c oxidase accessory protein CcoG [Bacteroidota bacterium]